MLHLVILFRENDGKENCAQVLEEEVNKMFHTKSLNDEHDCNVVSMNSLNIDNPQVQGIATIFEGRVFNPNLQIRHKGSQRIFASISN